MKEYKFPVKDTVWRPFENIYVWPRSDKLREIGKLAVKLICLPRVQNKCQIKKNIPGYFVKRNLSQRNMTSGPMTLIWETVCVLSDKFGHFVICLASGNQAGAQFDGSNFLWGQFFFQPPPQWGPPSSCLVAGLIRGGFLSFDSTSRPHQMITIIPLWDQNHLCCFDWNWLFSCSPHLLVGRARLV